MNYSDWSPVYDAILADFGFDRTADEYARDRLGELATTFDLDGLGREGPGREGFGREGPGREGFGREGPGREGFGRDGTVAICGGAPSLTADAELDSARDADRVVAAGAAIEICRAAGLRIDLAVTDLDSAPETAVALTREGTPVAVAAHGDNVPAIDRFVPRMTDRYVLPTTQARPRAPVVNLGGFTDGDRAAFIADHVGADRLVFPGWDFEDPGVTPLKRKKLEWAERLLYWLESRRGDCFAVLDGRRDDIDTDPLPID